MATTWLGQRGGDCVEACAFMTPEPEPKPDATDEALARFYVQLTPEGLA
jgi:hypothetical protein